MTLFPSGYDGNDADQVVDVFLPLDDLIVRHGQFHPEFERRLRAALTAAGGLVGIGGGWRSSDLQRSTFLARHTQVASGGCCTFDGKRYALKAGMAHAAPPGSSFHETQVFADGRSGVAAVDIVGHQESGPYSHTAANNWMRDNGPLFGLMTAHDWSVKEPWHVQMIELPRSVSTWKAEGRPNPTRWELPGDQPPVLPEVDMARITLGRIDKHADAYILFPATQDLLNRLGVLGQEPVILSCDTADLERKQGYKLTPLKGA